jgi:sec-independent protein translocase protein TatA
MFNLGWPEVLIVLGVAILIFGPKKFPELGGTFGKTLRGFKEGMTKSQSETAETVDDIRSVGDHRDS